MNRYVVLIFNHSIVSNIGITTYHLSRYLATLLLPLSESKHTVKNSNLFLEKVIAGKLPSNYKIVPLDAM